jgi:hypothetical protein
LFYAIGMEEIKIDDLVGTCIADLEENPEGKNPL